MCDSLDVEPDLKNLSFLIALEHSKENESKKNQSLLFFPKIQSRRGKESRIFFETNFKKSFLSETKKVVE